MGQLQKFAEKHEQRDNRMATYLEDLDAARHVEGQTVIQAFKLMVQDVEATKQQVHAQAQNMQEHSNNVKEYFMNGADKGMRAHELQEGVAIQVAVNNLSADIHSLKAAHWS